MSVGTGLPFELATVLLHVVIYRVIQVLFGIGLSFE